VARPKDQIYLWINRRWCKRCSICAEVCPTKVIEIEKTGYPVLAHMDKCIDCGMCVIMCPDYAIFDDQEDKKLLAKIL
jgi:2-oxoglutarate ferredoxin oxidoreductase subunit delta